MHNDLWRSGTGKYSILYKFVGRFRCLLNLRQYFYGIAK